MFLQPRVIVLQRFELLARKFPLLNEEFELLDADRFIVDDRNNIGADDASYLDLNKVKPVLFDFLLELGEDNLLPVVKVFGQ